MKWQVKEVDLYIQSKDYIDSVLIPLIPIDFAAELKTTASMGEYATALTGELERQFKGRVILTPSFTYLKKSGVQAVYSLLVEWKEHMHENGMKHVFFLTSDRDWLSYEQVLQPTLIWIPSLSLEHVDESYKRNIIGDQVQQIIPIFLEKWKR
ncbi:DUF2487 family protein [Priestia megaterium]|nr:DUF2487 family protein [Priestia megaterium]